MNKLKRSRKWHSNIKKKTKEINFLVFNICIFSYSLPNSLSKYLEKKMENFYKKKIIFHFSLSLLLTLS